MALYLYQNYYNDRNGDFDYDRWARTKNALEFAADKIGESIGREIQDASRQQTMATIQALNGCASQICGEINYVVEQIRINNDISCVIAQEHKRTNDILENISEILKIPESEKEREFAIRKGLQLFSNAKEEESLYEYALERFLYAEKLDPTDPFVLYEIGFIYLYIPSLTEVKKAYQYFIKAAKFSKALSTASSILYSSPINGAGYFQHKEAVTTKDGSKALAVSSYRNAALAAYILGDDEQATANQKEAIKIAPTGSLLVTLSKYLMHGGKEEESLNVLSSAIDMEPGCAVLLFGEPELSHSLSAINLVKSKSDQLLDNMVNLMKSLSTKQSQSQDAKILCKKLKDAIETHSIGEQAKIYSKCVIYSHQV